jgi:hypothetical protein
VWLVKLSPQCLLRGVERVDRRGKTSGVGMESAARVADGVKGGRVEGGAPFSGIDGQMGLEVCG